MTFSPVFSLNFLLNIRLENLHHRITDFFSQVESFLYPGSLDDPKGVEVRGFLAGILLPICLSLAMYL
jgi:hypothetical protein